MIKGMKPIMEEFARSKAYFHRHDVLRAMVALVNGIQMIPKAQLLGRENTEVAGHLRELLQLMNRTDEVKNYSPSGYLQYQKGKEKVLVMHLIKTIKKAKEEADRESFEQARERKLRIDRLLVRGQKYLEQEMLKEAEECFQSAVNMYVDEVKLFYFIATKLIITKYYKPALKYLQKAFEVDPDFDGNYLAAAEIYEKTKDFDKAEEYIRKALELFGDDIEYYVKLAQIQARAKKYDEGLKTVEKAMELDPAHHKLSEIHAFILRKKWGDKPPPEVMQGAPGA